jgi:hypothetical protein
MLSIVMGPGRFGPNLHLSWTDGEPVPKELHERPDDAVVQFTATGRELELIVHMLDGDDEYLRRTQEPEAANPLPAAAGQLAWVVIGMLVGSGDNDAAAYKTARELALRCVRMVAP